MCFTIMLYFQVPIHTWVSNISHNSKNKINVELKLMLLIQSMELEKKIVALKYPKPNQHAFQ